MRISGSKQQQMRLIILRSAILAIVALMLFPMSAALAASGKGWVETDWFRVLNFAVLVVALFFILRKPMSTALSSRIDGIKKQLADLEAQKEAAEKKLAEYSDKLSELEKEAEHIVADYVKQGNEAKARILKE
ncbi:MAG: ATP synthase F0 subunit B, partial [Deltaproteobacteria bacterium]|nr:ATP synthase F0 subunit B [Deltaproteobacteria bacterium]